MILEKAKLEDLQDVYLIEKTNFSKDEACSFEKMQKRYDAFSNGFYVLKNENNIIGFICFSYTDYDSFNDLMYDDINEFKSNGKNIAIYSVAIKKEKQGKGLGTFMLKSFLNELNVNNVILASRENLVSFYEACGFRKIGKSKSSHGNTLWIDMLLEV